LFIEGFSVVITVHDEIVLECPITEGDTAAIRLSEIMCTAPKWCSDLPLDVEVNILERYGK
jgi:DNA polymerase I-like protein with 3'-5' exonuclease and polymerase domains